MSGFCALLLRRLRSDQRKRLGRKARFSPQAHQHNTPLELLPHGQFMACVKAEFGWSQPWASQLMQIAERFSNANSSLHLPSSAKVLALLAADPSRASW